MFYPLFFKPVYKSIIWGGTSFEQLFGRTVEGADGKTAESWDICCHKNGMSVVQNGALAGQTLAELLQTHGKVLVGTKAAEMDRFPLLIKLIDANDKLSVQVHPENEYALRMHGDLGKTEMWYIIDAKPGAKLVYGTRPGTTKEEFAASLLDGSVEQHLNYVAVKKGDSVFIPAGTLHAIMDGLVIAEIQQNSDTTYRVFDWNRVDSNNQPRELHVQNALDVTNFDFVGKLEEPVKVSYEGYMLSKLVQCEFFQVDQLEVTGSFQDTTTADSFTAYTVVAGQGTLTHYGVAYPLVAGTSFLLPATMGSYEISGTVQLLKSWL